MLISALAEVKRRGGDTRTLGLYGQELIHITAAIARMNLVLHGVEDFDIASGNTLSSARLHRARPAADLRRGARQSAVLDQEVEPRGVAERPLGPQLPRHAAAGPRRLRLLPAHPEEPRPEDRPLRDPLPARRALPQRRGRDAAQARRVRPARVRARPRAEPLLQLADGSLRRHLPDAEARRARKGRILFIDAVHEVARERAQSFLQRRASGAHPAAYQAFADEPGFATVATIDEVLAKDGNLSIPRYVRPTPGARQRRRATTSRSAWAAFDADGREFWQQMDALVDMLDGVVAEEAADA